MTTSPFFVRRPQPVLLAGVLACLATDPAEAGAIHALTGFDVNETEFMKKIGLTLGGWASAGVTYNAMDPESKYNYPVTFNDRDSEFMGNQINVFLERAVNTEGKSWDFGFRADFMYGTDARFTQATGLDNNLIKYDDERFYQVAFPQLYAQIFAPIGNGVTATIGHFYTIIGNEVVTAPDNFFYSHAYTMQYGEPFTHTGVKFDTDITKNISVTAGAVMGWNNFSKNSEVWNFMGGVTFTTDDEKTSLALASVHGKVTEDRPDDDRWVYSVVLKHDFLDNLHFTIQHDQGAEQGLVEGKTARWYGINNYLTYDINEKYSVGVRGEWFRDHDDVRIGAGAGTSYYAFTVGMNYKPTDWFKVRPEVRYDWADGSRPYDDGNRGNQFLFATDFVVMF